MTLSFNSRQNLINTYYKKITYHLNFFDVTFPLFLRAQYRLNYELSEKCLIRIMWGFISRHKRVGSKWKMVSTVRNGILCVKIIAKQLTSINCEKSKKKLRSHRDLNSDRWIQSPEC